MKKRLRFATVWLGGCAGCHMSLLDLDEFLIDLAGQIELVFSPLADTKHYPANVDVALVEGAVANHDNLELIQAVRANTRYLISLGDCAVTGNVTALRNQLGGPAEVLHPVYLHSDAINPRVPDQAGIVPELLEKVLPVHAVVPVNLFLPGCPPPAPRIRAVLEQLLAGETPTLAGRTMLKFG
jgi:NAD-reducing hydrogenase small subunit